MTDLITRLSKLDAPDREVDAEIHSLFHETIWKFDDGRKVFRDIPAYTASVDAAIALAERELPGKGIDLLREAISELGKKYHWHICLKKPEQLRELPIQVCIALLRAKEASNEH
ncbi:hypothetical protein [Brucella anthropi]|uniref:hypothetical protein n=1 Tax=Brucella anthropi TaxID=529 RepID=UPI000F680326|nr:hypothetical protein [Brucella anthropi]RRY11357.1 hypothetical protein EGJ58_06750 [Brucella anthropi]